MFNYLLSRCGHHLIIFVNIYQYTVLRTYLCIPYRYIPHVCMYCVWLYSDFWGAQSTGHIWIVIWRRPIQISLSELCSGVAWRTKRCVQCVQGIPCVHCIHRMQCTLFTLCTHCAQCVHCILRKHCIQCRPWTHCVLCTHSGQCTIYAVCAMYTMNALHEYS